jgi:hypothetical protein
MPWCFVTINITRSRTRLLEKVLTPTSTKEAVDQLKPPRRGLSPQTKHVYAFSDTPRYAEEVHILCVDASEDDTIVYVRIPWQRALESALESALQSYNYIHVSRKANL